MGKVLADDGVDSGSALGIRFLIAAVLLAALQLARRGPLRPIGREWAIVAAIGGLLYSAQATSFYFGLEHMGAAAVALIAYCYPAMVAGFEVATGALRPSPQLTLAMVLSITGVAAVATAGGDTRITTLGVIGALGGAVGFAAYVIISHRYVRVSDPWAIAIWISFTAGLATAAKAVVTGTFDWPNRSSLGPYLVYGLATGIAFAALYAALRRLGATRTSVWLNLEAVTAVVLAGLFLGETLLPLQLLGGLAVGAGAVLATLASRAVLSDGESVEAPPG
jgi:drug/metabolite transporter (DMT)-like permease